MRRSADRILTTHVGSLPRPRPLTERLLAKDRGEPYDHDAFLHAVADAVAAVVQRQAAVGIDIVDDGEMSKPGYSTYIADRLSGFAGRSQRNPPLDTRDYPDFNAAMARMTGAQPIRRAQCVGAVTMMNRAPLETDIANLRAALAGAKVEEAFMTAAAPGLVTAFQPNGFYPTHEAYVEAVGAAMQEEYEAIAAAGFVLQLDCPDLAMAHHTAFQELSEREFLKRARHHVEVLNHAVRNIPADRMRIHICWGNYEGPHDHDIALAKVLPVLLKAKPAALVVEAANPRHEHEWSLWREVKLPPDRILVPGVIDTSTNYVEHPELVAERIERFAALVGRERVIAGTDCGFGTFAGYGKLDPDISFKKLASLAEGAAIASKRLWRRKTRGASARDGSARRGTAGRRTRRAPSRRTRSGGRGPNAPRRR
ncbi:MAG TPA: cobalamin-independent methionine synthase II family protein [Stellaceae bacterium]|nr:cobalamin-independent methionine synthase II family protein [Stellaceae bacterium]